MSAVYEPGGTRRAANADAAGQRLRLVTIHNQHQHIVVESAPPEDLPPLAESITGRPTEPAHIGAGFRAPPPDRQPSADAGSWFAEDPLASRAIGWAIVAAVVALVLLLVTRQ